MIIEKILPNICINPKDSISLALKKIDSNKMGFVFGVEDNGVLKGILTDGDLRRWLLKQSSVDLSRPVDFILNTSFIFVKETDDLAHAKKKFSDKIRFIPYINSHKRLTGFVRHRMDVEELKFGTRLINDDSPTFVISEIGLNHNGCTQKARKLIDLSKQAGADAVKFQMRNLNHLYRSTSDEKLNNEDLSAQYTINLLNKFNLPVEDMLRLFDYAQQIGLLVLCTPWEEESLNVLENYGIEAYKIASADLTNHPFLNKLCLTHKPLFLSTGMSTEEEINDSIKVLQKNGSSYALLHCNSTYPAPFKDINLSYISRLKTIGKCPVGYSGHERGIHVAISAISQGARIIEKHITLDRDLEGPDHMASLLPSEFKEMVIGIRQVQDAIGTDLPRTLSQGELMNRSNLSKSLVSTRDLEKGELIDSSAVTVLSPGRGLQPNRIGEILGKRLNRKISKGDFFFEGDFAKKFTTARMYSFNRPWGLTVRWHDFKELMDLSNPDFLEFHLSFSDMDEDIEKLFPSSLDMDLKVHSPDTFDGDHLLDLSNPDSNYRNRSIMELQRVVDLTRKLKVYFKRSSRPTIIASLGGFSTNGFISENEVLKRYSLLAKSLRSIDSDGVEIIGQTLPPFPWYFGGQMFLNLFVRPDDTVAFCKSENLRLCFDLSHSKLACNHFKLSFGDFIEKVGPYTSHLHIADAFGTDGEGLQIGDGEIDFTASCSLLQDVCPNIPFMPEIWQGHKNHGQGFWQALENLEQFGI